jgi:hypothetical protein
VVLASGIPPAAAEECGTFSLACRDVELQESMVRPELRIRSANGSEQSPFLPSPARTKAAVVACLG